MKGFTVRLPKQNIDPTGVIKERILKAAAEKLPFAKWYGVNTTEKDPEFSVEYAGPEDLLCFGMNRKAEFSALNKKFFRPTCPYNSYVTCPFANRAFELHEYNATTDLDRALARLDKYAKFMKDYKEDPGYDFEFMGQPVRIYQKFIQIGTAIIPTDDPYLYLDRVSKKQKDNIINIIINVSNSTKIVNVTEK